MAISLPTEGLIFSEFVSNLLIAIVLLLVGFIVGKLVGKLIQRALHEAEVDNILKKVGIKLSLEKLLSSLIKFLIYIAAIIMALNQLSITTAVLQLLMAGFIILLILFIILSMKDFVPNAVSGFFLYKNKVVKLGDKIKLGDISGTVDSISLVETKIKTKSGDSIYIPNSTLLKKELVVKKRKK